jgi:glycosyltransferase involved in cell wall biosynthesis
MRIAFDHQAFCRQVVGGISRYYCRLAEELALKQQEVGIFAPVHRNSYLKDLPEKLVHGYGIKNYPPKTAGLCVQANAWVARAMIRRWEPDVVHETYFSARGSDFFGRPSVTTVFDMISELEAEQRVNQLIDFRHTDKFQTVARAEHVICISEHTRQDLIRLFNVSPDKLSVIHLGCDLPPAILSDSSARSKSARPFLLYVGMRGGYKNFEGMIRAIADSTVLLKTFDIIAFGGGKFTDTEQSLLAYLGFGEQQVRQLSGNDQDLNLLYQQAAALIYPSQYEGFGLPPLEAMAMQCPVVSSNTSSMPEVIGDAGEYFDPAQTDSTRCAIERVVFSEKRTQELIAKGSERVKQFTWAQCAENTLEIYRAATSVNH